jgi:hypothetical protein
LQECFSAGYASFNLEQVQYSTTAGAAAYPEANKYDPRMSEQLPSKPNTASGKAGRLGTGTPRSAAGFPEGDTGLAGKDFDQHGQGGGYEAYHDTRVSHQDMVEGYPGARSNYWATAAAH